MDREEHLQWCKDRAMEYVEKGQLVAGVTSMLSDLNKHDETALSPDNVLSQFGMMECMNPQYESTKRFILGFN